MNATGFPNLAFLLGPNSSLGNSSVVRVMDRRLCICSQWLDRIDEAGSSAALDVRPDVQQSYNADLQRRLVGTAWASGCTSPPLDRQGHNSSIYPGLSSKYRKATAKLNPHDYELVRSNKE